MFPNKELKAIELHCFCFGRRVMRSYSEDPRRTRDPFPPFVVQNHILQNLFQWLISGPVISNVRGCPPNLPWKTQNMPVLCFNLEKMFSLYANSSPGLWEKYIAVLYHSSSGCGLCSPHCRAALCTLGLISPFCPTAWAWNISILV